jgi:hypothetical protein
VNTDLFWSIAIALMRKPLGLIGFFFCRDFPDIGEHSRSPVKP